MLDLLFAESRNLENPATPLNWDDPENWSISGETVSETSALRLSAVYACIAVLGRSLAQLPLHVLRNESGSVRPATEHPLYHLLHNEPNDWQTSYDWRESSMMHVNGWGNSYTWIERHRGEVSALHLVRPWECGLFKASTGRWIWSVADPELPVRAVQREDMIHIRAIGSDGRLGQSPIRQCRETFALGQAAQKYGNKFFGGGGRPTSLVTTKGSLNKEGWERLKDRWRSAKNRLRDEDNSTLLLPAELEYHQLTIAPEDAQFLETRKFNRSEIAGIFNVPAHMINDLEKATFSNISEQAIQFVRHTMMPWVVKYEQELTRKLFTETERRAGFYVKFNLNGLLRGTSKDRAEFYNYAIRGGWMSRNEVRSLEEMNRVDGLDEYTLSADLQPKKEPTK